MLWNLCNGMYCVIYVLFCMISISLVQVADIPYSMPLITNWIQDTHSKWQGWRYCWFLSTSGFAAPITICKPGRTVWYRVIPTHTSWSLTYCCYTSCVITAHVWSPTFTVSGPKCSTITRDVCTRTKYKRSPYSNTRNNRSKVS